MKVMDLMPGQEIELAGRRAIFVQQAPHPIYSGLRLVIWRLDSGEWSHDALDPYQEVGDALPSSIGERQQLLRHALLNEERPNIATAPIIRGETDAVVAGCGVPPRLRSNDQ